MDTTLVHMLYLMEVVELFTVDFTNLLDLQATTSTFEVCTTGIGIANDSSNRQVR